MFDFGKFLKKHSQYDYLLFNINMLVSICRSLSTHEYVTQQLSFHVYGYFMVFLMIIRGGGSKSGRPFCVTILKVQALGDFLLGSVHT